MNGENTKKNRFQEKPNLQEVPGRSLAAESISSRPHLGSWWYAVLVESWLVGYLRLCSLTESFGLEQSVFKGREESRVLCGRIVSKNPLVPVPVGA